MDVYSLTKEELDDTADSVKVVVLRSLVAEGLIEKEAAEEWAKRHTVISVKKSIFRTLSDIWIKEPVEKGKMCKMWWTAVKRTD